VVALDDPARPVVVGTAALPGPAQAVAVAGGYAYLVAKGGLWVFDVSQAAAPRQVAALALPGRLEQMAVNGETAYIVGNRGLYVVAIADPTQPVQSALLPIPGYAEAVAVEPERMAVAAGDGGLRLLPPAPVHPPGADSHLISLPGYAETGIPLPGYAEAVALAGKYAYVVNGDGLQVIDLARAAPVAFLNLPGYALDVTVAGRYAYLIDRDHGLVVVDISIPAAPVQVGALSTPGFVASVHVAGHMAYVTTLPRGDVHLIDWSVPSQPRQAAWVETLDTAEAVTTANGYLFVAGGYGGLEVLTPADVQGPGGNPPRLVARLASLGYAGDLLIKENHAYVAAEGGLQIVALRDPMQPVEAGCYCVLGAVADLAPAGQGLYVLSAEGVVHLVELDAPSLPRLRAELHLPEPAHAVVAAGPVAVVASDKAGVRIIAPVKRDGADARQATEQKPAIARTEDKSADLALVEVGVYGEDPVAGLAAAGSVVYLAALAHGVEVLDVSDPAHPQVVSRFDTPDQANQVAVHEDALLVADRAGGLLLLGAPTGATSVIATAN
jgi:hypothetical protein